MDLRDVFGDVPGRPDHPDFWLLSQQVLGLDATIENEPDIENIIKKYVDTDSLAYTAKQRASRVIDAGLAPEGALPLLAALYTEGFILGILVEQSRQKV
jgi:hypothetical protein